MRPQTPPSALPPGSPRPGWARRPLPPSPAQSQSPSPHSAPGSPSRGAYAESGGEEEASGPVQRRLPQPPPQPIVGPTSAAAVAGVVASHAAAAAPPPSPSTAHAQVPSSNTHFGLSGTEQLDKRTILLAVCRHKGHQVGLALWLAAISAPLVYMYAWSATHSAERFAVDLEPKPRVRMVNMVLSLLAAIGSGLITIYGWFHVMSRDAAAKARLPLIVSMVCFVSTLSYHIGILLSTGRSLGARGYWWLPFVVIFLIPIPATYWAARRVTRQIHGELNASGAPSPGSQNVIPLPGSVRPAVMVFALTLYALAINIAGVLYLSIVPGAFFGIEGSDFNRVAIRLFVHPVLFELILFAGRITGRMFRDLFKQEHIEILLVYPQFTGALWGRFLIANVNSPATQIVISLLLAVVDSVLRLTAIHRDRFLYKLRYGTQRSWWIFKTDIRHGYRDQLTLLDDIAEMTAILTAGLFVILGSISSEPGVDPASTNSVIGIVLLQFSIEVGVDFLLSVTVVHFGHATFAATGGNTAQGYLGSQKKSLRERVSEKIVGAYKQQLRMLQSFDERFEHHFGWMTVIGVSAILFLLVSYVGEYTCPYVRSNGSVVLTSCAAPEVFREDDMNPTEI